MAHTSTSSPPTSMATSVEDFLMQVGVCSGFSKLADLPVCCTISPSHSLALSFMHACGALQLPLGTDHKAAMVEQLVAERLLKSEQKTQQWAR